MTLNGLKDPNSRILITYLSYSKILLTLQSNIKYTIIIGIKIIRLKRCILRVDYNCGNMANKFIKRITFIRISLINYLVLVSVIDISSDAR